MNKRAILRHLREAKEQLDKTILEIETDAEFDFEGYGADMMHLYHHLNTAWNGRHVTDERHATCHQKDFDCWRKFPSNEELMLG